MIIDFNNNLITSKLFDYKYIIIDEVHDMSS